MIIHTDSGNPKPIEQKVRELILKKLYIKVDDEKIFIDKEDFIALILRDIIAIAKADYDMDSALEIALEEQNEYATIPDTKRNELEEAAMEFDVEIEAYKTYLEAVEENRSDDNIYMGILLILNSEFELLEKRLRELMIESLGLKISEDDAYKMKVDRQSLLDNYANYVKLIASNESVDAAAEEIYLKNKSNPHNNIDKNFIKSELEKFAPALKDEIDAYKLALSLNDQNAEFPMILATVKQLLDL